MTPLPDLSVMLVVALFQPETTDPVGPTAVLVSLASHQPDRPAIASGGTLSPDPPPDGGSVKRSGCHKAIRPPPIPIGLAGATSATLIQVTVNGVG